MTPEYESVLESFRAVSARYRAACIAYRRREIGDASYLRVRRELEEAQSVCDEAERREVNDVAVERG